MFKEIKNISQKLESCIIMFSCGRDSIVMLDLFHKYFKNKTKILYLYFYPNLSIRNEIIKYYENQYEIKIEQFPHWDTSYLYLKKIKFKQKDIEDYFRYKYNISYIAYGYRRSESIQRFGMLNNSNIKNGIDLKNKKCYPLMNWSRKQIEYYIKKERLKLSVDYYSGYRDINVFKGDALLWLYNNHKEDYEKIKIVYPGIEGELIRAKDGIGAI